MSAIVPGERGPWQDYYQRKIGKVGGRGGTPEGDEEEPTGDGRVHGGAGRGCGGDAKYNLLSTTTVTRSNREETIAKLESQIGDNKDTDNKAEESNHTESENKETPSESDDKPKQDESEDESEDSKLENKPLEDSPGGRRGRGRGWAAKSEPDGKFENSN